MNSYLLKLLIVDDKPDEREGIRSIINWDSIGITIVGVAENGLDGVEKARMLTPDIIITDIVMPQSDGFKMVEEIKEFLPNIKVIFISCFDNFNFVKSALDLDAMGYVLKPVISGELLATVSKVTGIHIRELERKKEEEGILHLLKENLPILREQFYKDILYDVFKNEDEIWEKNQFMDAGLKPGCFIVIIAEIYGNEARLDESSEISRQIQKIKVMECINNTCKNSGLNFSFFIAAIDKSRFALIICTPKELNTSNVFNIDGLAESLKNSVYEQFNLGLTIGVSSSACNVLQIGRCYQEACDALKFKFYLGKNQTINYSDVYYDSFNKLYTFNADEVQNNIKYLIRTGERNEIDQFVEKLFYNKEQELSSQYIQYMSIGIICSIQINLIELNESLSNIFDSEFVLFEKLFKYSTIPDIKQWLKNIIWSVSSFLNSKSRKKNKKVIDMMQEFINKHYTEELSVSEIADKVYLSPCYANYIFKKETGETLMEFLTGVRLKKAKELLKNSLLKVYEISEKVGYKSNSYFNSVFKEHCGMTPLEYRDRDEL